MMGSPTDKKFEELLEALQLVLDESEGKEAATIKQLILSVKKDREQFNALGNPQGGSSG